MANWLPALFVAGLVVLGSAAFFDVFGFDAIGPYLRGGAHTHRSTIAVVAAFWFAAGWFVLRLANRNNPRLED
ncbi:MAG TPA: hypothetical protein VHU18_14405 [Rhizomicrobium sp.]|jgi:hypothetical protein|nr:hypothetical protein [Rhizomicrobium sp.]